MLPMPGASNRMPRQPRPQRMQTIIEALKSGLKDSIKLNREKLQGMQQHQNDVKAARSRQGFHYNLDKQVKVAERYLRKLQFHLAKVEELQEQYEKELKVREGAVNMVKAYSDTPSPHKKEPVSEAKLGVKDCTQALCAMEAELEANLGAFVIKIEGIAGFARVCRGDVFEVAFKLGFQKFKSKCKVEKDLSQSWDGEEILLYPMVADFLTIKVTEIRGIARSNVVIGNLEFDTSDFYQAEPQNLTIDVNENGTIKLNVLATWSPFHIDEDDMKSPNKNSYHKRERAFTEPSLSTGHFNPDNSRSQSLRERSAPKPIDLGTNLVLTLEEALHNTTRLLEILNGQYGELKTLEHNVDQLNTMLKDIAEKKKRESIVSLSVKSALDSFDFLDHVEEQSNSDYEDSGSGSMEETNRRNTLDSTRSDSVISAGTDSTCSIDEYHPPSSSPTTPKNDTTSPKSDSSQQILLPERPIQRKRGSKFIEMSEKRESRLLELNEQRGSKLFETLDRQSKKSSTENGSESGSVLTCGNESVDMVLVQHLMYIEYLLSHLGAFGPLKLKETNALEKLHKQAVIIEQLITLCVTKMEVTAPDEILPDLKLNLPLLEFWEQSTGKDVLLVKADDFLLQLDVKFGAKLRTDHPDIADNVFESLCHRLVDRPVDLLSAKTVITLFQYITFFAEDERRHPEKFINDLTKEFELTASLEPGNPDLPKMVKKIPKGTMLPTGNLRALSLLLLEDSATVQTGVRMYYESISAESSIRQKVITVYLECLEERDQSLRQAGCAALAAMQATEALDQLVYLLRCDVDDVKTTAKVALMAFGEKGRLAYETISFASYGDYPPYPIESSGTPLQTTEL
ncbi:rho family-interacting cell polarization regulator 2-like isoform X2 [Amphiura filiformis]